MAKQKRPFMSGYRTYDTAEGFGNAKKWKAIFENRMGREEAQAVLSNYSKTAWEILGVDENATAQEITKAFRQAMMTWHPDRNAHREAEATAMAIQINAAYEFLRK